MRYVVKITRELWHLFVDDAALATAILAWSVLIWLGMRLGFSSFLAPEALSIGYGIILYLGAIDRARRVRPGGDRDRNA